LLTIKPLRRPMATKMTEEELGEFLTAIPYQACRDCNFDLETLSDGTATE